MKRALYAVLAALACAGCGSSTAAPPEEQVVEDTAGAEQAPTPPVAREAPRAAYEGRTGSGTSAVDPVKTCGPADSYAFVAQEFQCPDGTNPLGGDVSRAAQARLGNVGSNASGHVIDHYQVQCATGPVEIFVDMYGCPQMEEMLRSPTP